MQKRSSAGRTLGTMIAIVLGIGSLLAFFIASTAINWQPPAEPFSGWAVVLTPASSELAQNSQVKLTARLLSSGNTRKGSIIQYSVTTCGDRGFQGILLLGGDARLYDASVLGSSKQPSAMSNIADLSLQGGPASMPKSFGSVQAVNVVSDAIKCASKFTSDEEVPPFAGSAVVVEGRPYGTIRHQGPDWLPWDVPRTSQVWPLIGTFPGAPTNWLGEFVSTSGLRGSWLRPRQMYFAVDAGALRPHELVDNAHPDTEDAQVLHWQSTRPIRPSAYTIDNSRLGAWQQISTIAAIAFGIGGSILSTLIFDLLRKPAPQPSERGTRTDVIQTPQARAITSAAGANRKYHWTAIAFAAVIIAILAGRRGSQPLTSPKKVRPDPSGVDTSDS